MANKIDNELIKRLDEIEESASEGRGGEMAPQEVPVIITLTPDVDISALEAKGFKLNRRFGNISAVSGTLPADKEKIQEFAELDQVERIEYDGEMHALSN